MERTRSNPFGEESADPLDDWRSGEVWFRDLIPVGLPWGSESYLEAVPEEAAGSYGVKTGAYATVNGQRYEPGEVVVVDRREELLRLLPELGSATDLVFPWYDRMIPAALLVPHRARIDLVSYRSEFGSLF